MKLGVVFEGSRKVALGALASERLEAITEPEVGVMCAGTGTTRGQRLHKAVTALVKHGADAVMFTDGSTFYNDAYFSFVETALDMGCEVVMPMGMHVFCAEQERMVSLTPVHGVTGRVLSREFIKRVGRLVPRLTERDFAYQLNVTCGQSRSTMPLYSAAMEGQPFVLKALASHDEFIDYARHYRSTARIENAAQVLDTYLPGLRDALTNWATYA